MPFPENYRGDDNFVILKDKKYCFSIGLINKKGSFTYMFQIDVAYVKEFILSSFN